MELPKKARYIIIGAGIHGLSTAWHLAMELKVRGKYSGQDIVVLDKTGIAAGASGIACGVVRNFYFQPAMGEVMRVSVEIWEENQESLAYHPVGYLAGVPEVQASDLEAIYQRQSAGNYRSSLIRGEQEVNKYMKSLFPDWKARGITTVLHEHQGGVAFSPDAAHGLLHNIEAENVRVLTGVEVHGFTCPNGHVTSVETNHGSIETDQVVIAVGPWIKNMWNILGLPQKIDVRGSDGALHKNQEMWTYWRLQEGRIEVDPKMFVTEKGETPPVVHIDSIEPLTSTTSGEIINGTSWGIYFKQDRDGVQGGAVPEDMGPDAQVDPYGTDSPYYVVDDHFVDYWTSGLAHCLGRFEDAHLWYKYTPSGGIGAFTVDQFPVFDWMLPNVYVIADSNHGWKMIGVGREVARTLLGENSSVLHPFRFARYAEGDLHPTSNSPFPWS